MWHFDESLLPRDLERFEDDVATHRPALVVIDPFAGQVGGKVDGERVSRFSDSIRSVTTPLKRIAESYGPAIILIEHMVKHMNPRAHPLLAIGGGGSGLAAAVRVAYAFRIDPTEDDRFVLGCIKPGEHLPSDIPAYRFRLEVREFVADGVDGETSMFVPEGEVTFNVIDLLVRPAYLYAAPDHRAPSSEVLEDLGRHGHSKSTVRRAMKDRQIEEVRVKGQRAFDWVLPSELVDELDVEAEQDEDEDEGE